MTNLIPGAVYQPINIRGRDKRRKGRGLVGHVAVSRSTNLVPPSPGDPGPRTADWHLYLPKAGGLFQYIDLDYQSWATGAGNPDVVAFESEGGMGTAEQVNAEPWTDPQVEAAAHVLAYLNETEDVPLEAMADSLSTSRGFGVHRLGIDPWRVNAGQKWSTARGKLCPGDAKVAQVPVIVSRARELRGGSQSAIIRPPAVPTAPPAPLARPRVLPWSLPAGHWLGNVNGGPRQHGGHPRYDSRAIIDLVENVQEWTIYRGCVRGLAPASWQASGWADGLWETATDVAITEWHRRYYPGQQYPAQVWADDYRRLTA